MVFSHRKLLFAFAFVSAAAIPAYAQSPDMTFFITSAGPGNGANLGGLEGADAHCQALAEAAGITGKTWRAYLSTSSTNARDRIGSGPWANAKGEVIAESVDALHSDANAISKQTGLTEKGEMVNGRGDDPNRHDILTGSNADGTANENTCGDWTLNGEGSAIVGHHDRMGLRDDAPSKSWNSSHPSRGCSQENLRGTGGDGLFYCFAIN
ncbi:hypothetical protein GR183_19110 [Stappia sp. GBMRC 2046]|uniref:Lectin n=1 Tax=Stappia sediminis TaxID=2692190 RepID=A0A7X3LXS7_9HYPH|nr:hypothetical protein [Stappia sediminis]MXN67028.1 hypothetical protein [Stappia sediminis]